MWVQIGGDFVNLDNLAGVNFGRSEEGELTAQAETASGSTRRYTGDEALALREALEALCCHGTADWPTVR
jgi:hypothetical protein